MGWVSDWMIDSWRNDIARFQAKVSILLADKAAGKNVREDDIRSYYQEIARCERQIDEARRAENRKQLALQQQKERERKAYEENQRQIQQKREAYAREAYSLRMEEQTRQIERFHQEAAERHSPKKMVSTPLQNSANTPISTPATPRPPDAPSVQPAEVPWCVDADTASIVHAMLRAGRSRTQACERLAERGWPSDRAMEAVRMIEASSGYESPDSHASVFSKFGGAPSDTAKLRALALPIRGTQAIADILLQSHASWRKLEPRKLHALINHLCGRPQTGEPVAQPRSQETATPTQAAASARRVNSTAAPTSQAQTPDLRLMPWCIDFETAEIIASMLQYGRTKAQIYGRLSERGWPMDKAAEAVTAVERDLGTSFLASSVSTIHELRGWPCDPTFLRGLAQQGHDARTIVGLLKGSASPGWKRMSDEGVLKIVTYVCKQRTWR